MPINKNKNENFDRLAGQNAPLTDEIDLKIIRLLQDNAKLTIREIAAAVHLTPTPVHERVKKLEASGVIRQYATLIDPAKVNRSLMVICYISLKEHNKGAGSKFIQKINQMPEVIECYNISGEFDFMLKVLAEGMEKYYDFHVNRLSQLENIGHVQSVFVMGIIKDTHKVI